ncbi:MAG: hypothetical protein R3261_13550, partial [Alphaproteobacteria bacterium]|nr:hypothetical protein [Alphaproteobacteria bacterium]
VFFCSISNQVEAHFISAICNEIRYRTDTSWKAGNITCLASGSLIDLFGRVDILKGDIFGLETKFNRCPHFDLPTRL